MKKITFEDGVQTSGAKVNIAGTDYPVTPAEYEGNTPLSAYLLNKMQDYMQENIEDEVQTTITTEEAKEHTITDSAEVNGKINITGGNTEQDGTPTPDAPKDVVSVGSNVNFLNNTATTQTVNGITFKVNSDGTVLVNGTSTALASITLATNPSFEGNAILSGCPSGGSDSKYFIQYSDNVSISYKDFGNGINIRHLTGTNCVVVIAIRSGVTINNLLFKPQIKKETAIYTRYNCGSIDFLIRNKNLLNKDGGFRTGYIDANGEFMSDGQNALFDYILVKENYNYIVSFNTSIRNCNVAFYDKNKNFLSKGTAGSNIQTYTFQTPTNTKYIIYYFSYQSNVQMTQAIIDSLDIQLEENTTSTTYIQHKEQIISVPLPEGMELCKIGNYKDYIYRSGDKWYKHKEFVFVNIDSATTSNVTSIASNTFWGYSYRTINPNIDLYGKSASTYINVLSDKFKVVSQTVETQSGICLASFGHSDSFELRFRVPQTYTQQEAIDFINGTKVYYPCVPVEEEITDTDTLEALYQIEHLLMYENYTLVQCLNDVAPYTKVEYYYNNDINNTYAKRLDEVDETIKNLDISGVGGDSLPVGTELDFDGEVSDIPLGWEQVDDVPVYSTTETVCGTWIDGKPLYRKVIELTELPSSGQTKTFGTNLNVSEVSIKRLEGYMYSSENFFTLPETGSPTTNPTYGTRMYLSYSNPSNIAVTIMSGADRSSFNAHIIIEYTKTTD